MNHDDDDDDYSIDGKDRKRNFNWVLSASRGIVLNKNSSDDIMVGD